MISNRIFNIWLIFLAVLVLTAAQAVDAGFASAADRAVEIARRSRDRIESSGTLLKESSRKMFSEFAVRTGSLQKLLDTRARLEKAGMLDKKDPLGRARKANIDARIILEVGALKDVCDKNLDPLLSSLESFDRSVAESIVDTQATRSISDNHELSLKTYKSSESERFARAAAAAEDLLDRIQNTDDTNLKERLLAKYHRVKNRIRAINQRRVLYETRLKIAAMNQVLSDRTRANIRKHGAAIPQKIVDVMSDLNNIFLKLVPVAEAGGTGFADTMSSIGFTELKQLSETLDIVSDSTKKLNRVIDGMVKEVLKGFDGIQQVDDETVSNGGACSHEKEMEFIRKERADINKKRAAWNKG